jgi:hypothetical protein
MRKIYTLIALFTVGVMGHSSADTTIKSLSNNEKKAYTKKVSNLKSRKLAKSNSDATSRWYDYGQAVSQYTMANSGDSSALGTYLLFSDSTLKYEFSDGLGNTFHALGQVLQASDTTFNTQDFSGEMKLLPTSSYTVDTVLTEFFYNRNLTTQNGAMVVDSLIIELGSNTANTQLPTVGFTANAFFTDNFGVDAPSFKDLSYRYQRNGLGVFGNYKRYAIALDSAFYADTTDYGSNIVVLPTSDLGAISAGRLVVMGMAFKPGYTWNANVDTLNNFNYLSFIHYTEMSSDHANTLRYFQNNNFNMAYVALTDMRYNLDPNWNGSMYPRLGFSKAYDIDQYYFMYKISSSNAGIVTVGLNEVAANSSASVFPNPTTNMVNVNLINATSLRMVDINGKVVYSENVSNKNNTVIDMTNLAKGIYSLQVVTTTGVETKKVVKQ